MYGKEIMPINFVRTDEGKLVKTRHYCWQILINKNMHQIDLKSTYTTGYKVVMVDNEEMTSQRRYLYFI